MRKVLLQKKSHQSWSWILIVSFFLLSIVNVYFGFLGLMCMFMPMLHAVKGHGKLHCSHYCPRGSFFGRFLERISINRALPDFMRSTWFKHLMLTAMIGMFALAMIHAHGDPKAMAFAIFRLMLVSFVVGAVMGILYKPRAWCQVCPMGHGTGLVNRARNKMSAAN